MTTQSPSRLRTWLHIDPAARTQIYRQVYAAAPLGSFPYWLEILLSAGIATLGLVLNSPAVIIGAMLISPLMGPIMAAGLGLAAGDLYLALRAVTKLLLSMAVAAALSAALVWILPFHSATAEILGRTNPTLLDLGIALLSGIAGSVAVSRSVGSADGVTTVPGVAIAVALMPPLCTVGFGIGSGLQSGIIRGAGLLFITNIVAIVFSAFLIFLALGINSPEVRAEMQRSRAQDPLAQRLASGPLASAMRDGGKLHWRVLFLIALLAAVAWPLQIALRQLTGEARTRDIVEQELATLIPKGRLVSQQTEVGSSSVAVHVVTSTAIPPEAIRKAEAETSRRSGRAASITVEGIASQTELAQLMERLDTRVVPAPVPPPPTPPPPPPPPPLSGQGAALQKRVAPILTEVWPPQTPLVDFSVIFAPDHPILQVRYQAPRPLDPIAVDLLTSALQTRLESPGLTLAPVRIPTPRTSKHHR